MQIQIQCLSQPTLGDQHSKPIVATTSAARINMGPPVLIRREVTYTYLLVVRRN